MARALITPHLYGKRCAVPVQASNAMEERSDTEKNMLRRFLILIGCIAALASWVIRLGVSEADEIVDLPVHIRGSTLTLGRQVPRGVPQIVAGPHPPSIGSEQSGRLELAEWLASPEHPLTGRVIVNRMWRWHFGPGNAGTPAH
jgi:hypothetical protein